MVANFSMKGPWRVTLSIAVRGKQSPGVQAALDHWLFGAGGAAKSSLQGRLGPQPELDFDDPVRPHQQGDKAMGVSHRSFGGARSL